MGDMTKEERILLYNNAMALWGEEAQLRMLTEECSELIQVCMKLMRPNLDDLSLQLHRDNFIEELVDVSIMLEQFMLAGGTSKDNFKLGKSIAEVKSIKLARLQDSIAAYSKFNHDLDYDEDDWLE